MKKSNRHNPQLDGTVAEGTPRRINLTPTTPNTEMNKDELKKRIAVEQAYLNGEEIEMVLLSHINDTYPDWTTCSAPSFDWTHLMYRVKPTPKYIPFDSADKVLNAIKEHGNIVTPMTTNSVTRYSMIVGISVNNIHIYDCGMTTPMLHSYKHFLKEFAFADGTPCGIKITD